MQPTSEIVPKPWGYEYCAFDNGRAAVWILHIARGQKTSRHCHPNKKTVLIPLQGDVHVNGRYIEPLDPVVIDKGEYHQTEVRSPHETASMNGSFLMEIEEPSNKGDIVREADDYGRAGKPIESQTVKTSAPLLTLSEREKSAMGYTFKLERTLGGPVPDLTIELGGEILGIYKDKTRKASDCVADFIRGLGIRHVFGVAGGGSMHLNDSFHDIFVPMHHEQAAAMAAEAYSRLEGIGCALLTTGPGGTNAVTGVACAWVDSIPVIFLSGQVTKDTLLAGSGLRQRGIQESDISSIVAPITKHAVTVTKAEDLRYELEKAAYIARSGRSGPVWVDIPLDIQGAQVKWDQLRAFEPTQAPLDHAIWPGIEALELLRNAERPVLVIGNGVRLANAEKACRTLVDHLGIPVVSSWTAADIIPTDHPLYIGRFGIFGDRGSNFAVQNADLLLVIGSRLSIPQTGHNVATFAREAKIVWVDADEAEMKKLPAAMRIVQDARDFIELCLYQKRPAPPPSWIARCRDWKARYEVVSSETRDGAMFKTNSFRFIEALSRDLPSDAIVVTDMGTAFTCTFQAARMKLGQRWFTASGHAPMGYALPGAIGAHYATGQRITCIVGDGSLMFNVQELQTISERGLPIDIYVLNNGGYLTMKHTQANHFGRFVGSEFSFPSPWDIGNAFGVKMNEIHMDPMQPLIPRSSSMKRPDGSIASRPIEDMYPFLPRDVLKKEMIVKPVEVLE
jgi:acetolactate synthase-1/2/3 large subunit